jgi:transposase-like protein
MDRSVGAAARLPESDREELAIQALARSETVSDLAARHGVSRKFVHQQAHKARVALDDVFSPETPEDGDRRRFGGQAAIAACGYVSLSDWNLCLKPEPSVPL